MIELLIEDQRGNIITHQLGEGRHTLGHSTDADIVIMDEFTSRYHADIFINHAGAYIIDMNSTNGTWCDGKRIKTTLKMEPGMVVSVGKMKLSTRIPKHRLYVKDGRKADLSEIEEAARQKSSTGEAQDRKSNVS